MLYTYYFKNLCELKFSIRSTKTDLVIDNKMVSYNANTSLFFLEKELPSIFVNVSPRTFVLPEIIERKEEGEVKIIKGENFTILSYKRTNNCVLYLGETLRFFGKLKGLKLLLFSVETESPIDVEKVHNLSRMIEHENIDFDRLEYPFYFSWCEDNLYDYANIYILDKYKKLKMNK